MRRVTVLMIGIVSVSLLAATGYAVMGRAEEKPAAAQEASAAALTVTTALAELRRHPQIIEASGPIVAWQEAVIGAEVGGQRLTSVLVDVGDAVTKGQLLAEYNDATLRAEAAELKAAFAQADAARKRAVALKSTGAMSDQEIDNAIAQAAMAKARLDAKSLELRYTKVIAPDDGVISARSATLGAVGAVGQELFRLIRQNRIEWRGELTSAQLNQVAIGQAVVLTLPDSSPAEAAIRQIAPSLNDQTRLATIYADINEGSAARAGMYAKGRIARDTVDALSVPAKAVVIRDGYSYVFKIAQPDKDESAVALQKITAGPTHGSYTDVIEGLSAGDVIAVQGAGFLNDGDVVRIATQE